MSLADRHLSQFGRFGDTEIYHTSEGETWHVSPEEKNMMESLGPVGEKIVSEIGAGTINPDTGLEEQFPWIPFLLGAAVVTSVAGSYAAGSKAEGTAEHQSALTQSAIEGLGPIHQAAQRSYDMQSKDNEQTYERKMEEASEKTSFSFEDLREKVSTITRNTNMPTGGFVKEQAKRPWDVLVNQFESVKDDLSAGYSRAQGILSGKFGEKVSKINAERTKLMAQKAMYDDQADDWYLGKYLGKFIGAFGGSHSASGGK